MENIPGNDIRIPLLLLHQKHVGEPGEQGEGNRLCQVVGLPHLGEGRVVPIGHRPVEGDGHFVRRGGIDGDKHVHLSPPHLALHLGFDGFLSKDVEAGDLHRTVQVAVVHCADFHGDGSVVEDCLPRP